MNLRQLLHRIVHDYVGGPALVLETWNFGREKNKMSEQMFNNKLNHHSISHNTNVTEFEQALDAIPGGWHALAIESAKRCNCVVVQIPDIPESDMGGLDLYMSEMAAVGDFAKEFQQAYADGVIDSRESDALDIKNDKVISTALAFKDWYHQIKRDQ